MFNRLYLKDLSLEFTIKINTIEKEVYNIAGNEFNLSSPKQLGELLFEKLDLDRKKSRKTKTGWSTDAAVLEKLESDHPIVKMIIEHRTISKLLNTYVDALPQLIEKETGRVHTDFNQAVTATGRLSSSNPNLQNIPVRTEFSRRIRKAFLPQKDWKLLSADYSQIELRILTHLSGEEVLKNAYLKNEDVHSLTAKILFEKDAITKAFDEELRYFLDQIDDTDVPSNFTTFYNNNKKTDEIVEGKIKYNNKILHQSKLVNYFNGDYAKSKIEQDLDKFLKKIKKDKKYTLSKKDIIFIEALKADGIEISKKYKDLYEINESEMPADIQRLIDNKEIGAALLRIVEVIGPDKIEDIDDDTFYFIVNALNQLNADLIRNKLLLKVLPLKV